MKTLILFAAFLMTSVDVMAETIQWSKGYTGGCTNATQREDGSPLLATEIAKVEYYLDKNDGDIISPEMTVIMTGGCKDTFINTKQVGTGDYFIYARTFDTDGRVSVASSPGVLVTIQKARPNPPSGLR